MSAKTFSSKPASRRFASRMSWARLYPAAQQGIDVDEVADLGSGEQGFEFAGGHVVRVQGWAEF